MSLWRQLTHGLRNLMHPSARDQDVADEVEHYFEQAESELRLGGLSADDARRAARLEAGNRTVVKERVNSYGWENAVRSFAGDLRFAGRQLRKHPVFTVTATLTLALGIGANTAIFTVVQSVLLAPLPYRNADRLAVLDTHWTNSGHTTPRVTGPDAGDVRDQTRSMEAVSLYNGGTLGVALRDHSAYTVVTLADANFWRVFGVQPAAGRLFTQADADRAAVVSAQFARDNFGSAQAALGQVVRVEGEPLEITGVLPEGFGFPSNTEVWEARSLLKSKWDARSAFNYKAVGLLRSGVSFAAAQTELDGLSERLKVAYPETNRNKQMVMEPLERALTGDVRPTCGTRCGAWRQ